MFPCFGGGKNPKHLIAAIGKGMAIAIKHLVIAQSVGGHQSVGQPPAGVWNQKRSLKDLTIRWQLSKLGAMQSIASSFLPPPLR